MQGATSPGCPKAAAHLFPAACNTGCPGCFHRAARCRAKLSKSIPQPRTRTPTQSTRFSSTERRDQRRISVEGLFCLRTWSFSIGHYRTQFNLLPQHRKRKPSGNFGVESFYLCCPSLSGPILLCEEDTGHSG